MKSIQLHLSKLTILTLSAVIIIGTIELMRITTGNPIRFLSSFFDPIIFPGVPAWILAANAIELVLLISALLGVYGWFRGIITCLKK